jgi:hypothetical protein
MFAKIQSYAGDLGYNTPRKSLFTAIFSKKIIKSYGFVLLGDSIGV